MSESNEQQLQSAVLTAVNATRRTIDTALVAAAVRNGKPEHLADALGIVDGRLPTLDASLRALVIPRLAIIREVAVAEVLNGLNATKAQQDAVSGAPALTLIDSTTGDLSLASANGVIAALLPALALNLHADAVARILRNIVGLTDGQSRSAISLARLLATIEHSSTSAPRIRVTEMRSLNASQRNIIRAAGASGITRERAEQIFSKQTDVMLQHRARAAASWMSTYVINEAQHHAASAIASSTGANVRRFWVTAADERVRWNHTATSQMNSRGVHIDEPFRTPMGTTMAPPLEHGCRCRVEYRVDGGER